MFSHGMAKQVCAANDAHLVEVHSKIEQEFLLSELSKFGYPNMRVGIIYSYEYGNQQFVFLLFDSICTPVTYTKFYHEMKLCI